MLAAIGAGTSWHQLPTAEITAADLRQKIGGLEADRKKLKSSSKSMVTVNSKTDISLEMVRYVNSTEAKGGS